MINTKFTFTIKSDKDGNLNIGLKRKDVAIIGNKKTKQEEDFLVYAEKLLQAVIKNGFGLQGDEDGKQFSK